MQALLTKIDGFDEIVPDKLKQLARDIVGWCGDELCAKNIYVYKFSEYNRQIIFDWSDKNGRVPLDWMKKYSYHDSCKLELLYTGEWHIDFNAPGCQSLMSCKTIQGVQYQVNRDIEYIKVFLGLSPPFWIGEYNSRK